MRSAISAKLKVAANVRTFSFIAKHLSVFLLFFQQNFTLVKSKHCTYQIKTLHLAFQHLTAVGELCHCRGTAVLPPWENFTTEVTLHCYRSDTALLPQQENFATAVAMQCYCGGGRTEVVTSFTGFTKQHIHVFCLSLIFMSSV